MRPESVIGEGRGVACRGFGFDGEVKHAGGVGDGRRVAACPGGQVRDDRCGAGPIGFRNVAVSVSQLEGDRARWWSPVQGAGQRAGCDDHIRQAQVLDRGWSRHAVFVGADISCQANRPHVAVEVVVA